MKRKISFQEIVDAIQCVDLPSVDLVLGIARGGIVPASLLAYQLGVDLQVISVNYRDDSNTPRFEEPRVLSFPDIPSGTTVLLVDDVSVTGSTLDTARKALVGSTVVTLVLKGRADHVLFPDISTCIEVPWSAEGEMVSKFETEKLI